MRSRNRVGSEETAMTMTMKVYQVTPNGQRRDVGKTITVPQGDRERLPESLAYAPCTCRQCKNTDR